MVDKQTLKTNKLQARKLPLPTSSGTNKKGSVIIQKHHLDRNPKNNDFSNLAYITKGEHKILTLCQWFTKKLISDGFLTALADIIIDNNRRCVDLKPEYERRVAAKKKGGKE